MSYPVRLSDAARRDVEQLPDRDTKLAALRAALALGENPHLGTPLRNRLGIGDLSQCRRLSFDHDDWTGKPRHRLVVYSNDPDDGAIAVVRVISVGVRERLAAYRAAAARLRSERRRRFRRG